jgi:hypothetical protein
MDLCHWRRPPEHRNFNVLRSLLGYGAACFGGGGLPTFQMNVTPSFSWVITSNNNMAVARNF